MSCQRYISKKSNFGKTRNLYRQLHQIVQFQDSSNISMPSILQWHRFYSVALRLFRQSLRAATELN